MSGAPLFEFTDRCYPIAQVGHGASSTSPSTGGRWDVALWDDVGFAEWAGAEPTWTDATEFLISATSESGRRRATSSFDFGDCTLVFDNTSGWANTGTPAADGQPALTKGQAIRVGVVHSVYGIRWKFRGYIDSVVAEWAAEEWPTVVVRALDPLGEVGRVDLAESIPRPDEEPASDRIEAILDAAPWVAEKREIDDVATELIEAPLDGKVTELLQRCAESVGGWVFGDVDGNLVFRSSSWLTGEASRTAAAVITNDPAVSAPIKVCPAGWTRPDRRADVAGRVILSTTGGEPVVRESLSTIDDNGAESVSVRDLWTKSTSVLESLGDRLLVLRSPDSVPRVETVTIDAHHAGDNRAAVDLLTIADPTAATRVRCRHIDVTGDVVFDDQCFVVGMRQRITREAWSAELIVDRSDPFVVPTGPHYWDVDNWNQAQWS